MADASEKYIAVAGWMKHQVYPILSEGMVDVSKDIQTFIEAQPDGVKDLLAWEAQIYEKEPSEEDPLPRVFVSTKHPKVLLSRPKRWRGTGNMPWFYACPSCKGRLFWSLAFCPWCGVHPAMHLNPKEGDPNTYLNLVEFLYPQSARPQLSRIIGSISESLDTLKRSDDDAVITKSDMNEIMRNIDRYLPVEARTNL
jgi:hypothetical protein